MAATLDNPFLKAQEKALRITYIPSQLKGIIVRESGSSDKGKRNVKSLKKPKR